MKLIRWLLGRIILGIDFLTMPKGVRRSDAEQAEVDRQTQSLSLYQFQACPFCVKVRRGLKRQSLTLALKDAKSDPDARDELLRGGGRVQVPCLRIQQPDGSVEWLYESSAILDYLQQRFAVN